MRINHNKNIARLMFLIVRDKQIPVFLKKRIIKDLLWSSTEDDINGKSIKYKIKLWSPEALQKFRRTKNTKGLIHEHIFPRKLVREKIMKLNSQNKIYTILNTYCHAAIITKRQNKVLDSKSLRQKLPVGFEKSNPIERLYSRYIKSRIELLKVDYISKGKVNSKHYVLKKNRKGKIQLVSK